MDVRLLIASWPTPSPRGAVSRFCTEHQISRSQFYEIRGRAEREGVTAALATRSRRPRTSPTAVAVQIEDLAVRLRKQLAEDGWDNGPVSVAQDMRRLGLVPPSVSTLARIFTRRGLVVPAPQKRPRSSLRWFTFPAPNACWQLDATEWTLLDDTTVVIFQVLDDHSRRILASLVAPSETAAAACQVVDTAIARYGVPQLFLTDNGTALNPSRRGHVGQLATALRALGVKPITSRPGHPQTCGKDERVHSTLKRYLRAHPRAKDIAELQTRVDAFDEHYNTVRPHQSLHGLTPLQMWDATPATPPPPLPQPHTPAPADPGLHVTQPKVCGGKVSVAGRFIQLGWEHRGHTLIAVRDGQRVDLFDQHGTHLRTVTFEPGRLYYGNGRPRGGNLAMRRSTKTPTHQPSDMS